MNDHGADQSYAVTAGDWFTTQHVVCRACGRTEDVDRVDGVARCLDPAESAGFVVDRAEVVFWGECPDCRSR
jgi:Fur family ferric uptake transcriptional regulator